MDSGYKVSPYPPNISAAVLYKVTQPWALAKDSGEPACQSQPCFPPPTLLCQPSFQNVPYLLSLHVFPTHSLVISSQPSLCPQHPRGSCQGLQGVLPAPGVWLSLLPSCFEASSGSATSPALTGGFLPPLHLALCSSTSLAWHPCFPLRHRSTQLWPSSVEIPMDLGEPDLVGKERGADESCLACGGSCPQPRCIT